MKVITLLNEKGGVGKTSLAVHVAMGLAHRGAKVLLVDGDPQGHATIRCGIRKGPGLYDLLVRDAEWPDALKVVPPERYGIPGEKLPEGRVWVLPSNVETRGIAGALGEPERLRLRLDEMDGAVDVVVIDTSPTPSLLHGVFYTATDGIVYPTELTFLSFDGLVESIKHRMAADKVRHERWGLPKIAVLGIVPMKFRENTNEQQENLVELRKQFDDLVWQPIKMRTVWTESESRALPVFNLEPNGPAAWDCWEIVDKAEEVAHVKA